MRKYADILKNVLLFKGIDIDRLDTLLHCFGYKMEHYDKNEIIFNENDNLNSCRIVLSGKVQLFRNDFMGNRVIMLMIEPGGTFGEIISCAHRKCMINAIAESDCDIIKIDLSKIAVPCSVSCPMHSNIILNLLEILASKALLFDARINILSKKNMRERILEYFNYQMEMTGQRCFSLPFNREELADYLCINRSVLSKELSKMQEENLIVFKKNNFEILYDANYFLKYN